MSAGHIFHSQVHILRELGVTVDRNQKILDFGCGNGELVAAYRSQGYHTYGCDLRFKAGTGVDSMSEEGILRIIDEGDYRLPFADETFDIVVSNRVFEHIRDYGLALLEIRRVLKAGGATLHVFPSRYGPIEQHLHVPLASIIRCYPWLLLWASLGIRNRYQRGLSARETAAANRDYLIYNTNYLTGTAIRDHVLLHFGNIRFCEREYLKYSLKAQFVYRASWILPFLPSLYGTFRNRVIFFRKV